MTHDAVWFSRPRKYGKGSRQWCVAACIEYSKTELTNQIYSMKSGIWNGELLGLDLREYANVFWSLESSAASARTRLVSSANMASTSAASASVRSLLRSVSLRCVYQLKMCVCSILNMCHTLEPVKAIYRHSLVLFFLRFHLFASTRMSLQTCSICGYWNIEYDRMEKVSRRGRSTE